MNQRGIAMGKEFRGKGVNVQLGPMMSVSYSEAGYLRFLTIVAKIGTS